MSIKIITGPLIPSRLKPNTDVMMIEPEKPSNAELQLDSIAAQEEFIASPQMPIFITNLFTTHYPTSSIDKAKETYKKLGFFIPEILPAEYEEAISDQVFIIALLPDNWKKHPTSHTNISCVKDEKNRTRIRIYLKNTRIDRFAHSIILSRYTIEDKLELGDPITDHKIKYQVIDRSNDNVIFETSTASQSSAEDFIQFVNNNYVLKMDTHKWMDENFPEWKDPFAYWD